MKLLAALSCGSLSLLLSFGCADSLDDDGKNKDGGSINKSGECDDTTLGDVRCNNDDSSVFDVCGIGGWEEGGTCTAGCKSGTCASADCSEGQTRCTPTGLVEYCNPIAQGFEDARACPTGDVCAVDSCVDQVCFPGSQICDGNQSRLCNEFGTGSSLLTDCPETCAPGLGCQSFCALAADARTSVGCLFYPIDTNLGDGSSDDNYGYNLMVANTSDEETANVVLEFREDDGTWTEAATTALGPNASINWLATCNSQCNPAMPLIGPDRHAENSGIFDDLAMKVTTDRPVVVYQLNSDDYVGAAISPAASIVLPTSAIDKNYYAMTWPVCGTSQTDSAYINIVPAEDDTDVAIRLAPDTGVTGAGDIDDYEPGENVFLTLQEGQLLQLATTQVGDDMTGSYIEADKPVSVYSGSEDACPPVSGFTQDSMMEMMLPLVAWGKEFVAAAAPWNTSLYTTIWRVLASEDETTVSFLNEGGLPGVPASDIVLNAGEFTEFTVEGNATNPGEFYISADKPIQPIQAIEGETAMVLSVPVEQFLPDYVFLTTPGYYNEQLTITRFAGTDVTVDMAPVSSIWHPAGNDWEVAQVTMPTDTTHFVDSTPGGKMIYGVGITISGNGGACSFSYIGGLNQERINDDPG